MKPLIRLLTMCLVAGGILLSTQSADAQSRIATIDLRKVFDDYWKTKQADARLKENAAVKDEEKAQMLDRLKQGDQDYQALLESANDQAVSVAERERRRKDAEAKLQELQRMQQNVQAFDRSARAELGEQQARMRENILGEIQKIIDSKARAGNYQLVLDVAGMSKSDTKIVLFHSGENDLTEEILTEMNSTAPPALQDGTPRE
ncbi:MAG TPA: OmpH family outer membrane protein [Methylomirabilota bacterium]|nr:OmpH family outer membrane protein [Methylomirabilota bacterium]